MGNFRSDSGSRSGGRSGGFSSRSSSGFGGRSRERYSGRSEGRSGFGRDRDSERRPREMHEVTCDKCGKQCQVPFRPSGDKPVLCSDCFREKSDSNNNFSPRNQDKSTQSGISSEQFNKLNTKLDKILSVLQDLELEVDETEDAEDEDDDEDLESDEDEVSEDESEDNKEDDSEDKEEEKGKKKGSKK